MGSLGSYLRVSFDKTGKLTLKSSFDLVDNFVSKFVGIVVIGLTLVVFYETILRYVFNAPTKWAHEYSTVAYVWITFMMIGNLSRISHIRVEFFVSLLSPKTRTVLETLSLGLCLLYGVILAVYGTVSTLVDLSISAKTLVSFLPLWIISASVPLGLAIYSAHVVRLLCTKCHILCVEHLTTTPRIVDNPLFYLSVYGIVLAFSILSFHMNVGIGLVVMLLFLILVGTPIAVCLGITACAANYFLYGLQTFIKFPELLFFSTENFILIAIPLFVFCGNILGRSGMAVDLFKFVALWFGRIPGSLLVATIFTSAVFAAVSGASTPNAAVLAAIAVPALLKFGHDKEISCGVVAAGGTLGPLIPPSLPMIVIGAITGESVAKLFMAGLIPGIIIALIFIAYTVFVSWKTKKCQAYVAVSWKEKFASLKPALWTFGMPILILGTIYTGMATVTESAAIGVVYGIAVSLATKKLKLKDIFSLSIDSATTNCMLIFIFMGAILIGDLVTLVRMPQKLLFAVAGAGLTNWQFIAVVMFIVLILGCLMDGMTITLLLIPILHSIVGKLGLNFIWFAVLFLVNIEIGNLTPPVGLNLFVVASVTRIPLTTVIKGCLPFIILMLISLLLFWMVPELVLFIPNKM